MAAQGLMGAFRKCWECQKRIVIFQDPFVSQRIVCLVDKTHETAAYEPLCNGCLYVRYLDLKNESHAESRMQVGESLSDDIKTFRIKDAEKPRTEQKLSEPRANRTRRKNRGKVC